jgi:HEAT repeat protein
MRAFLAAVALLFALPAARADEQDDRLARQLSGVVRDPRELIDARVVAVRTLAKIGPRAAAAIPDLVAVLNRLRNDEQEPLQEAIVDALGAIGAPAKQALPTLARVAPRSTDIGQAVKRSTVLILAASDAQDIDALMRQLISADASIRLRATKALATLGPDAIAAVPALVPVLVDIDADVRRGAIVALRLIQPNARPSEALIRAIGTDLTDPDPNVRLLAVRSLGRIGPPAAILSPALDALRGDPDPDIRRAATDALGRVGAAP